MHKIISTSLAFVFLLAACEQNVSTPAVPTPIPSTQTTVPPTAETMAPTGENTETPLAEISLKTQTGTSYTLDWSPDGKALAVASGFEITLLADDLQKTLTVLKPEGGALGVAWSPDQRQFATVNGFRNRAITLWDWDPTSNAPVLKQRIQAGSDQYAVSWSPDGKRLATLGNDRQTVIQLWDTETWQELHKYELDYTNPRRALNWSPDSSTIYDAGEQDGQVVMFALNVADGSVHNLAKTMLTQAAVFAISPDAKAIAMADEHGHVRVFDPATAGLLIQFQSVDQPVDMVWNPSGTTLAILGYKSKLQLWQIPR